MLWALGRLRYRCGEEPLGSILVERAAAAYLAQLDCQGSGVDVKQASVVAWSCATLRSVCYHPFLRRLPAGAAPC